MAFGQLSPVLKQRFFDANGLPLAGGLLYSYQAATTTPQPTFTDQTLTVQNSNPVVLDAQGYANVWMSQNAYKFVLADSNNVTQFTVDQVWSFTQFFNQLFNVKSLGFLPYTYPTRFTFVNNQAATNLAGEAWDGTIYSSIRYEYEIQQSTTIFTNGDFYLQFLNGTWQLTVADSSDTGVTNGVVFSITQVGSVAQLQAAETGGLGNGKISLKKSYHLVTP